MESQLIADNSLRKHGLFALIPVRRWHHDLWYRAAPMFLHTFFAAGIAAVFLAILNGLDEDTTPSGQVIIIGIVMLAVVIVIPALLAFYGWRLIRNWNRRPVLGAIYFLYFPAMVALFWQLLSSSAGAKLGVLAAIGFGLLLLLAEWGGLSTMLAWAMRASRHQFAVIGSTIGSIVPISLTMVVFSYFSPGVWQVVDQVTGKQMTAFAFFVFGLALIATITSARSEISVQLPPQTAKLVPRLNVYLVIIVTQLIQAFLFFAIISLLLLLLGLIIINDAAIETWIHHQPAHYSIGKFELPFGRIRFYSAYFIATFSTLSFLISTTTDAARRDQLFSPTILHVRKILERNS